MNNIELTFYGPNIITDFERKPLPDHSESSGVYIWGFMPQDKFIPYYVGEIFSTNIASRLIQHRNSIKKPASTYVRLTKDYMEGVNPYYSDGKYPFITFGPRKGGKDTLPKWVEEHFDHFIGKIDYMNNLAFLKRKYEGYTETAKKKDYPINEPFGMGVEAYDYLKENIGNMQAMYAECRLPSFWGSSKEKKREFYCFLETFVKCSLRGRTGSNSWNFKTYVKKRDEIGVNFKIVNLAKYDQIFKSEPSDNEYPGY